MRVKRSSNKSSARILSPLSFMPGRYGTGSTGYHRAAAGLVTPKAQRPAETGRSRCRCNCHSTAWAYPRPVQTVSATKGLDTVTSPFALTVMCIPPIERRVGPSFEM